MYVNIKVFSNKISHYVEITKEIPGGMMLALSTLFQEVSTYSLAQCVPALEDDSDCQ